MKAKVVKQFIDKNTKELRKVNEELTMSKERYQEINGTSRGTFVEEIKEEKTEEKTDEKVEENTEEETEKKVEKKPKSNK